MENILLLAIPCWDGFTALRRCTARAVRRKLSQRLPATYKQVKREIPESTTPGMDEWTEWKEEIKPGHFWTFDHQMDYVRNQFLSTNRHPKCVLRSEHSIKSLIYTFTKGEKDTGQCIIHSVPSEHLEILQWLSNLNLGIK